MPELPEVEVTRQSFGDRILGSRVQAVFVGKPLRWPLGCDAASLIGLSVGAASRRGKYIWLPLGTGGLLLHLGMSGSLVFAGELPPRGKHDHFELVTSHGVLRMTDPRRFGAVIWAPGWDEGAAAKLLERLGMEPLDPAFNGQALHAGLQSRRVSVKQALLSGKIVVGAGNIYACEALFRAGIDPHTPSNRLGPARCERLADAIRATLTQALKLGGSTLRDFHDAHGAAGQFQTQAMVYGREGEPCVNCGTAIKRLSQNHRSTYYCPRCQRR